MKCRICGEKIFAEDIEGIWYWCKPCRRLFRKEELKEHEPRKKL